MSFQAVKLAKIVNSGATVESAKEQLIQNGVQGLEKIKVHLKPEAYEKRKYFL